MGSLCIHHDGIMHTIGSTIQDGRYFELCLGRFYATDVSVMYLKIDNNILNFLLSSVMASKQSLCISWSNKRYLIIKKPNWG